MLCLRRTEGESFIVACPDGSQIEVKVYRANDGRLKLAIDAPKAYRIVRSELLDNAATQFGSD